MSLAPPALSPPENRLGWKNLWRELRPRQWTKNLLVFTALFFALGDKQQPQITLAQFWPAALAFLLFSIISSGVYVINDLRDREQDRAHPVKSRRPIAAGRITPRQGLVLALICLGTGLAGGWLFAWRLGLVLSGYVVLQIAYTLWLKQLALVDVLVIAAGFVLRVVAGGVAVGAVISYWLLICAFLMALFLALCKRRHEKRLMLETHNTRFRPSLAASNPRLLDILIGLVALAAIGAYTAYTQWPATVEKFQTRLLWITVPIVVLGMVRYLDLVYRQAKGDQPEYILLTDLPLMIVMALFGIAVLTIVVI
jgi:4-hydroxybenzoate polyprenyltransferase